MSVSRLSDSGKLHKTETRIESLHDSGLECVWQLLSMRSFRAFLDASWHSVLYETTPLYSRGRHRVIVSTDLCSRLLEKNVSETGGVVITSSTRGKAQQRFTFVLSAEYLYIYIYI